jgi:hypothetical protein
VPPVAELHLVAVERCDDRTIAAAATLWAGPHQTFQGQDRPRPIPEALSKRRQVTLGHFVSVSTGNHLFMVDQQAHFLHLEAMLERSLDDPKPGKMSLVESEVLVKVTAAQRSPQKLRIDYSIHLFEAHAYRVSQLLR